jgi:succinoglycan biosynthesis protein ExoV
MKLYYFQSEPGNFGDDLNPWLWGRLIPELLDDDENTRFVGIGTLLNDRVPQEPFKVVFGSGAGYGRPPELDDRWRFYCVRGPLTAKALGLDPRLAITDAAALLATVEFSPVTKDGGTAFIPHHASVINADWQSVCRQVGIRYIDPRADVETVIREIRRSTCIVTEAMHGAIFADTFRVPWKAVRCYEHILDSKWQDWCASLGMTYSPERLPGIWDADHKRTRLVQLKDTVKRNLAAVGISSRRWSPVAPVKSSPREVALLVDRFSRLASGGGFCLSDQATFEGTLTRLQDALRRLKNDYCPS